MYFSAVQTNHFLTHYVSSVSGFYFVETLSKNGKMSFFNCFFLKDKMRCCSCFIFSLKACTFCSLIPVLSPAEEYVTCHTCRSPDTILQKDTRLYFLQCETCHSRCSVASIKTGFQAVTGKRAQLRAKAN